MWEVIVSLLLANAIVILIIFAFLRSFRATIAPAISIPVSLIGTLAAIWAAGFSINLLTLLALVRGDRPRRRRRDRRDRNIARHRSLGAGPRAAAVLGTKEIVFCGDGNNRDAGSGPSFRSRSCPASSAALFSEFGFVLAFAVSISAAVALTVCPMLASKFGTGAEGEAGESAPGLLTRFYMGAVEVCLKLRWIVVLICLAFGVLGWFAFQSLKQEITPLEDRGIIKISLERARGRQPRLHWRSSPRRSRTCSSNIGTRARSPTS